MGTMMTLWKLVLATSWCVLKGTILTATSASITTSSPSNTTNHTFFSSITPSTASSPYRSSSFPLVTSNNHSALPRTLEEKVTQDTQDKENISWRSQSCHTRYVMEKKCERLQNCSGPCEENNTTTSYEEEMVEDEFVNGSNSDCCQENNSFFNETEMSCDDGLDVTASYDSLLLNWTNPCYGNSLREIWLNEKRLNVSDTTCLNNFKVTKLNPFTTYTVKVIYDGETCYKYDRTRNTAPTEPRNLNITLPDFRTSSHESRMAHITWDPPEHMNGKMKQYILTFSSNTETYKICLFNESRNRNHRLGLWDYHFYPPFYPSRHQCDDYKTCRCEFCTSTKCTNYKTELRPESSYNFSVMAENKEVGKSPPATKTLETTAGIPFFTVHYPLRYGLNNVTHESITLFFNGASISNMNGKVRSYKLWMKKNKKDCDNKMNQDSSPQEVYYEELTSTPRKEIPIVIAKDSPSKGNRPEYESLYNLEPRTCYTFYITISTKLHKKRSNIINVWTKDAPMGNQIYVLLATIITILVGVTIAFLIYSHRFRVNYFYSSYKRAESMELPMVVPHPPDINVERRILLSDLPATVDTLFSEGEALLKTEYADLQMISTSKTCHHARRPANRSKCRYLNVLPYDETRVVLNEYSWIPDSNFINASYIHGYTKPREFIACQGPLTNTLSDFWRMVWEKNVHVIAMVTQCVERAKEKCSKYWPDVSSSFSFCDILLKVKHLGEKDHRQDGYIHRILQLSKRHKVREIHQFHFVSWPDMGSPSTPDQLINFVKVVKGQVPAGSSHVVIHCSAGVGRTGTFIGLCNLMEEMKEQSSIDIFHAVYRMRLNRVNMVQTQTQYSFLYKCVLKYYLDLNGETHRWPNIERRLENREVIPDVINGTLSGVKMNNTSKTSEEEIK